MKRLLIILFCLLGVSLNAATYYVKTSGSDVNNGLSDATAWAHHPWMSTWVGSTTLRPGDIVCMKREDVWTIASPSTDYLIVGQSGSAGNYITTTAYGTGALPIINISTSTNENVIRAIGKSYIKFDNIEITHCSSAYSVGKIGIWVTNDGSNVSHDWIIINCVIHNIPHTAIYFNKDCYNIIIGDTAAVKTATDTEYSNHIYDFGYCGIMLMGVNPVTEESHFYVYHNYIHDATRTAMNNNEYGISITANSSSVNWPKYVYVRYNNVQNIKTWEGISTHGGSYLYFQDNYIKTFGTRGMMIGGSHLSGYAPEVGHHQWVEKNIIESPASGWVAGNEDSFIHVSYGDAAVVPCASNIYIRDNTMFYTSKPSGNAFYGIRGGDIDGMSIEGNSIYNGSARAAIWLNLDYGTSGVKNVAVKNNSITGWARGVSLQAEAIIGRVDVINNTICDSNTDVYVYGNLPLTADLYMNNNGCIIEDVKRHCVFNNKSLMINNKIIIK